MDIYEKLNILRTCGQVFSPRMEKAPARRASRTLNLLKPAPRRTAVNGVIKDAVSTDEICAHTEVAIVEKENRQAGRRATRGMKLEKPAPLKASKINGINKDDVAVMLQETNGFTQLGPQGNKTMDVQDHCIPTKGETFPHAALPHNAAQGKAAELIQEALSGMDVAQNCTKQPRHIHRQTRQLSQVSDDSGVGDMSSYSRQSSLLQSQPENQDNLDWDDIDNSPETTFSLGSKQMACLPSAVNQVRPFNSLAANDDILRKNVNGDNIGKVRLQRGRKHSYQNKTSNQSYQNFTRSYSVPANLSSENNNSNNNIQRETEFWDDEADFGLNHQESLPHNHTSDSLYSINSKDGENGLTEDAFEELDKQTNVSEVIEDHSKDVDDLEEETLGKNQETSNSLMDAINYLDNIGEKPKSDVQTPEKFMDDIIHQNVPAELHLPFDLDAIENELEFMRDDLDLSESVNSVTSKSFDSVIKAIKSDKERKATVVREPLHPHSTQQEIWRAEEGMPTGHDSAKGRRAMFRYYRECAIDERETDKTMSLIQYTATELLQVACRDLSKQKPETWSYLTKIFPDICLNKISDFDAERYSLERSYVVEVNYFLGKGKPR